MIQMINGYRVISYISKKLTCNLKMPPVWKRENIYKQAIFGGSMLVFRGCIFSFLDQPNF